MTDHPEPLAARLRRLGYVDKRRSGADERTVELSLTEAGRELRERAAGIPGAVAACLLTGADDYRETRSLLEKLLERVEDRTITLPA